MKRRVIFAIFALMLFSISFIGCSSQQPLCPAYGDSEVEMQDLETEKLPES